MDYEYPTEITQPKQPAAAYETVSLHDKDAAEAAGTKTHIYSES